MNIQLSAILPSRPYKSKVVAALACSRQTMRHGIRHSGAISAHWRMRMSPRQSKHLTSTRLMQNSRKSHCRDYRGSFQRQSSRLSLVPGTRPVRVTVRLRNRCVRHTMGRKRATIGVGAAGDGVIMGSARDAVAHIRALECQKNRTLTWSRGRHRSGGSGRWALQKSDAEKHNCKTCRT